MDVVNLVLLSPMWLMHSLLQKLGNLAGDALHAEILRDNVHDAWVDPSCGNWAAGVDKMYFSLGMQSPFLGPAGVGAVDPHTFRRNMGDAYKRNWAGLHDSPRTAPSVCANLARVCAGLLGQARCLQSPILSFPSRF